MGCMQSGAAASTAEDLVVSAATGGADGGGGPGSGGGGSGGGGAGGSATAAAAAAFQQHRAAAATAHAATGTGGPRALHATALTAAATAEAGGATAGARPAGRPPVAPPRPSGPRAAAGAAASGPRHLGLPPAQGGTAAGGPGATHGVRRLLVLDRLPPSAGGASPFGEPGSAAGRPPPLHHGFVRPRPGFGAAPELAHFMLQYRDLRPEDFDLLSKLDEGVPRRGTAPPGLVERLPRMRARNCGSAECGVCLAAFSPDLEVVRLPCRHAFHTECISRWLTEFRSTCPLCAAPVKGAEGGGAA